MDQGNNVACHAETSSVIDKLYESPEFVRFQMLAPLRLLAEDGSDSETLGKLFSCSMTTFLRVPSPRLLAAALGAVFPEDAALVQEDELALLVEALVEAALVPLSSQITATMLAEVQGQTLVRVNLLNMTRIAHHHFDYKRDGHSRVYEMRFTSSSAPPPPQTSADPEQPYIPGQVGLIRREDEHRIPFGELRAVSLIALLRMGLDPSQVSISLSLALALALSLSLSRSLLRARARSLARSLSLSELVILCSTAAAVLQLVCEDAAFRRHGTVEHSLRWRAVGLHRSRYSRASAKDPRP
jgi:hypothetical protein